MLLLRKPKPDTIRRFLNAQAKLDFTYPAVGATAGEPPEGFVVDHTRCRLGEGEDIFTVARSALASWQHLRLGWLEVWSADAPIRSGNVVAVAARALGLWWLNACRIVYLIDEPSDPNRWGFAYGTLPDHAGAGEERFLVEMDAEGSVWYDILAFSRPQQFLARIGYPYLRRVQRRFGTQSVAAMKEAIAKAPCKQ